MKYEVVESREIIWCEYDDRYVLIVKSNDKIIGLNFMQGGDFDFFLEQYNDIDEKLTDFYNAVSPYLCSELDELDRINQAIWAFGNYRVLRDERF